MTATSATIAAIAFDLGNVLVAVDHLRFCRRLAPLAGMSPEAVYAAVFQTGLEPGYDTGRLSSREFHRRLEAHFHLDLPYSRFIEIWTEIFDPLDDMEEVAAHLARRYPLYLLSNTNPLHFRYIETHFAELLRHFRAFILSYREGSRKPEAAIFQALIRQVGLPPAQILFIDDKEDFVVAARTHGLVAWPFVSPGDFKEKLVAEGLW
ncbi:MAG: HAD family phosphatase [Deltaproteobacteria bacterium]|nr:HAD family phosphatase [Deltaproteobacteria bacterium]